MCWFSSSCGFLGHVGGTHLRIDLSLIGLQNSLQMDVASASFSPTAQVDDLVLFHFFDGPLARVVTPWLPSVSDAKHWVNGGAFCLTTENEQHRILRRSIHQSLELRIFTHSHIVYTTILAMVGPTGRTRS